MPRLKNNVIIAVILYVLFFCSTSLYASDRRSSDPSVDSLKQMVSDTADSDTGRVDMSSADTTVLIADSTVIDSLDLEPRLYVFDDDTLLFNAYRTEQDVGIRGPNPTHQLFKSMLVPGWGQYSNGRFIKGSLILALESYIIYRALDNSRKADDWRARWQAAEDDALRSQYFNEYVTYRDNRNGNLWMLAGTIFISMFDAYVDAHLATFPEKKVSAGKISLEVEPGERPEVKLSYRF